MAQNRRILANQLIGDYLGQVLSDWQSQDSKSQFIAKSELEPDIANSNCSYTIVTIILTLKKCYCRWHLNFDRAKKKAVSYASRWTLITGWLSKANVVCVPDKEPKVNSKSI